MEFLGMNLDHPHLAPQAAALLSMTDELRIKAMRTERWIGFARARYTLGHLQSLCDYAHRSERRAIRHGYY
jgi:hypothetical protein